MIPLNFVHTAFSVQQFLFDFFYQKVLQNAYNGIGKCSLYIQCYVRGGCINNRYFIRFTKLQAICVLFEPEGFTYEFVNNSKNFTVKFQRRVF